MAKSFFLVSSLCPKPTSKEWKQQLYYTAQRTSFRPKPTSKEWKLPRKVCWNHKIRVRSLPRRNENWYEGYTQKQRCCLSEAYLEGMKTKMKVFRTHPNNLCPKPTSKEWKLEYWKVFVCFIASPKPTSKEWKLLCRTGTAYFFNPSEAYLEGMKTSSSF